MVPWGCAGAAHTPIDQPTSRPVCKAQEAKAACKRSDVGLLPAASKSCNLGALMPDHCRGGWVQGALTLMPGGGSAAEQAFFWGPSWSVQWRPFRRIIWKVR
jgi:hypothetical protein